MWPPLGKKHTRIIEFEIISNKTHGQVMRTFLPLWPSYASMALFAELYIVNLHYFWLTYGHFLGQVMIACTLAFFTITGATSMLPATIRPYAKPFPMHFASNGISLKADLINYRFCHSNRLYATRHF